MKQGTKLILTFVGAGVATGVLLSGTVAEATSAHPKVAMGGEGLAALGGAFWAWKKKSMFGAAIGGAAAGLLAGSVKGALSAPVTPTEPAPPELTLPPPSIAVGEPAPARPTIGEPAVLYTQPPKVPR